MLRRGPQLVPRRPRDGGKCAGLSDLASSVESTEGAYFVSAFSGLLAPRWRDDARAAPSRIELAHDRRHVARAVLEGSRIAVQRRHPKVWPRTLPINRRRCTSTEASRSPTSYCRCRPTALGLVARPSDVETTRSARPSRHGLGSGVFSSLEDVPGAAGCTALFGGARHGRAAFAFRHIVEARAAKLGGARRPSRRRTELGRTGFDG